MKIAIQGHPTRGKEVIQILESLGGVNERTLFGYGVALYYYINYNYDNIINCHDHEYVNKYCKKYTLEEFEKEFSFKVGDRVISITTNFIGTITKLSENGWYYVKYDNGNFACAFSQNLKPYKEMERNVTLTLEKAKEWYKKGGELKEIALQAFTEEELTKVELPKSWEEFCENYPIRKGESWIGLQNNICTCSHEGMCRVYKNMTPSKKSAEAHLALIQLEQLRDCWRQGWKPTEHEPVYTIKFSVNCLAVYKFNSREFLSFPSKEMAEDFLKCFRDLIEKAGDLI